MFHKRAMNIKINSKMPPSKDPLQRCLRLIYKDEQSSFENLSEKNNTVSTHHRNPQTLALEMFEVFKDLSPILFN